MYLFEYGVINKDGSGLTEQYESKTISSASTFEKLVIQAEKYIKLRLPLPVITVVSFNLGKAGLRIADKQKMHEYVWIHQILRYL